MNRARLVAAAALLAVGGVAYAEGEHAHEGIFVQLDLGVGYLRSELDAPGLDLTLDGAAGEFSVAVGYNVLPGVIVGGQLWGATAGDPDVEVNGVSQAGDDTTITLSGIGVNVTYYFMPLNVYVQATPSITTLTGERDDVDLESDAGFGIRLAVGKEWWVSDNWALGLNAQFAYSSNDDDGPPSGTFSSQWLGLAFSATYD